MYLTFLYSFLTAAFLFLISLLLGMACLKKKRTAFESGITYLCYCSGIGLLIIPNLVLGLGMVGGFNTLAIYILFFFLCVFSLFQLPALSAELKKIAMVPSHLQDKLVQIFLVVCLFIALLIIAPQSFLPDVSYDVVEYHLGGISEFIKAGSIHRIEGNFYAGLPFLNEMLFGAGLLLEGGANGGSPKLITLGFLILSCFTLYALTGHATQSRCLRLGACLLFIMHPLIMRIAIVSKNDMGVTAFVLLSLLCWAEWRKTSRTTFGVLMGIFAGAAVACKFTALGVYVIPAILFLVPLAMNAAEESKLKKIVQNQVLVGGCALIVFLPWMIKAAVLYGNPLFPLLSNLLPSEAFSAEQYNFYSKHLGAASLLSQGFWQAAVGRFQHYGVSRVFPGFGSWLLLVIPVFLLPMFRGKRKLGFCMLCAFLTGHLACNVLTANPNRFHAPLLPLLIFACAVFFEELKKINASLKFTPLLFLAIILVDLALMSPLILTGSGVKYLTGQKGYQSREAYRKRALGKPPGEAYDFAEKQLDKDATVLLLYDANWYFFQQNVIANTVYDRSALAKLLRESKAESAGKFLQYLQQQKIDYVFVNEFELIRFITDVTPVNMLSKRFPNYSNEGQLRAALREKRNHAYLVQQHDLYPPYQFDQLSQAEVQLLTEFFELLQSRLVYESGPKPYPRIWIAKIKS